MSLGTYVFEDQPKQQVQIFPSTSQQALGTGDGSQFAKNSPCGLTLWLIGSNNRHHSLASKDQKEIFLVYLELTNRLENFLCTFEYTRKVSMLKVGAFKRHFSS